MTVKTNIYNHPTLHTSSKGSGGGNGDGDGGNGMLEQRVKRLEDGFDRMEGKIDKLAESTANLRETVAEINGKLTHMPTYWGLAGLVVAVFGGALLIFRFAATG